MGGMDRRSFLFGAFRGSDVSDAAPIRVGPEAEAEVGGGSGWAAGGAPQAQRGAVIRIGRWRDFPIGESRILGPQGLLIESLPEGLRARSESSGGKCFGITADPFGELAVDPSEIWDEGMVYSIMVAGPVRLESPLEENNERR